MQPAGLAGYAQLASRSLTAHLHDVTVPFASLDDIIAFKEAAGRLRDNAT